MTQVIPIKTDRLILRHLRPEDATSIYDYASDPEITSYVAFEPHKSLDDSIAFIEKSLANPSQESLDQNFAIAFKEIPDVVIGTVSLKENNHPYEGVMSYVLARKYWRQGVMYEACSALMKIAFKERGMKRVFATCTRENVASKSLMKKLGMRYEGCLRANSYSKERFWDLEYYSILDDEYALTSF